jgi:hypothetical protein
MKQFLDVRRNFRDMIDCSLVIEPSFLCLTSYAVKTVIGVPFQFYLAAIAGLHILYASQRSANYCAKIW